MRPYAYHRPRSLAEALALGAAEPGARFIAGGTDVLVQLRHRAPRPPALISLRGVPELTGITLDGGARLGAMTTIAELLGHEGLRQRFPVLAEAAAALGSPQIRNAATLGGNLCNASPCADTATALLVLEARLGLRGPAGAREVALDDFFLGPGQTRLAPGEILAEVILPPPSPGARGAFRKKGRVKMDLALASVAVQLQTEGTICRRVRIAAGSVAPRPLRLQEVEAALEGQALTAEVLATAQERARRAVAPISDVRATAEYRRQIVGVYLRRALQELAAVQG